MRSPLLKLRCGVMLLVLAAAWPAAGRGQNLRDLVDAALDEKVSRRIEVTDKPIRDALHAVEEATGLRFDVAPEALDWLPYGEQTRVSLVIADISVRDALARILGGLGLMLHVVDDRVAIEPAPVLDRLSRRLTLGEVRTLEKLAGGPWATLKPGAIALQFRLPTQGEPAGDAAQMLNQALKAAPPAPALEQLEVTTGALGWLWAPTADGVLVYSRSEDVQQRLDRPIDVHYRSVPLDELLVDLGKRIGIIVHFEPGALSRVGARDRTVDMVQRGTSVRQILELLAGRTGLAYEVVEDGVAVGSATKSPNAGAPEQRPAVVAILRVPVGTDGTTVDFIIRADELPEELRQLRERKLPLIINLIREELQLSAKP